MLIRSIKLCAISFALFLSDVQSIFANAGWSVSSTVTDLRIYDGRAVFGNLPDLAEVPICPNGDPSVKQFRLLVDIPLFSETYAILLAAQVSGGQVRVYYTGECVSGRALINGARLVN